MPQWKQVNRSTHLTSVFVAPSFLVLSGFLSPVSCGFAGGEVWKVRGYQRLLKEVGGGPKHNTWSVGTLAAPLLLLLEFIMS